MLKKLFVAHMFWSDIFNMCVTEHGKFNIKNGGVEAGSTAAVCLSKEVVV
jgi:hypothetical protein